MIQRIPTGVMQVTWTGTAAKLSDLMDTASAGKGAAALLLKPNYILLNPEDVVRVTLDWSTPSATVGIELIDLSAHYFEGTLDKITIINVAKVNIMVWFKSPD